MRLPLRPVAGGRLRAALPGTIPVPEGRWDVYVEQGDAEPRRLGPGLNDLRALLDRSPGTDTSPLAVRIPYATKHGNLSLRSWLRAPHAEAGEIRVDTAGVVVHGRLHRIERPAGWLAEAVAEARCRRDASLVCAVPLLADGPDFRFTLDYEQLAASWRGGAEVWDLWLRPAAGSRPEKDAVRIARILDDVVDKKQIFSYPAQPVAAPHGAAQAGPYYTGDNDLAVLVEEGRVVGHR